MDFVCCWLLLAPGERDGTNRFRMIGFNQRCAFSSLKKNHGVSFSSPADLTAIITCAPSVAPPSHLISDRAFASKHVYTTRLMRLRSDLADSGALSLKFQNASFPLVGRIGRRCQRLSWPSKLSRPQTRLSVQPGSQRSTFLTPLTADTLTLFPAADSARRSGGRNWSDF